MRDGDDEFHHYHHDDIRSFQTKQSQLVTEYQRQYVINDTCMNS